MLQHNHTTPPSAHWFFLCTLPAGRRIRGEASLSTSSVRFSFDRYAQFSSEAVNLELFHRYPFFQNGAKCGFEMCFGPSTMGAGCAGAKTRLESRIKKFTPHRVCSPRAYLFVKVDFAQRLQLSKRCDVPQRDNLLRVQR